MKTLPPLKPYTLLLGQMTSHAILFFDEQGMIVEWSAGAQALFGWTADEAIGRHGSILYTTEDLRKGLPVAEMQAARLAGQAATSHLFTAKGGGSVFAEGAINVLRSPGGTDAIGYVQILCAGALAQKNGKVAQKQSRVARILVADDDADMAHMLSALLTAYGHVVQIAGSGYSAIEAAKGFRPDIAILDIGMPDMTGYEVAQKLRTLPEARGTVLVALTGWASEQDKSRSEQAGFHFHLTKPVDLGTITDIINGMQCAY